MKIGILTAFRPELDFIRMAKEAEAQGFDSVWVGEHTAIPWEHKTPYIGSENSPIPEPFHRWGDSLIALTAAAMVTKHIKVCTGITQLVERDPIVTAKALATLDIISGGRVIFGVGAGWLKEEVEFRGIKFMSRWKRLRESVEATKEIWTKTPAEYEGEFIRFPKLRIEIKPIQKPHPPILLAAHGEKGLRRVARTYDGWFPEANDPDQFEKDINLLRKLMRDVGRDPDKLDISPSMNLESVKMSTDLLKRYRDAGANRVVPYDLGLEWSVGHEVVKKLAPIVEMAERAG